jgi:hypothetical protein
VPIAPITILSLGAIIPPIPNAEEGIICGITKAPAATVAVLLTKSLLDVLFAILIDLSYNNMQKN